MGLWTPDARCGRFWHYPSEKLVKKDIRLVLIDLDNTLCPWHTLDVSEEAICWIQTVKGMGIGVMLITNAKPRRAAEAGKLLDLPYTALAKKPWPFALRKAMRMAGCSGQETLLFGDQIFTDVECARLAGCRVVLTEPISEKEMQWTRFMRRLEKRLR